MLADIVPHLTTFGFVSGANKRCGRCQTILPLSAFGIRNRRGRGDIQAYCKECLKAYNREWYVRIGKQMRNAAAKRRTLPPQNVATPTPPTPNQ